MKKAFTLIFALCCVLGLQAQRPVFVWYSDSSVSVRSDVDSVSFSVPAISSLVTLTTGDPVTVTQVNMTATYNASGWNFGGNASKLGVCFSTSNPTPTTADNVVVSGTYKLGDWSATIAGFSASQTVYYRAFAELGSQTVYGDVKSFTSASISDPVDLGLSVKWAPVNLGAASEEDFGGFYSWGETTPKQFYDDSTYVYGSNKVMTKYNATDGKTVLDLDDDAAHATLGGNWRMPTLEEVNELLTQCTWTKEAKGWRVTGSTGNSIFFPCNGNIQHEHNGNANYYGFLWTSTVSEADNANANVLTFSIAPWMGNNYHQASNLIPRWQGLSIRPVCP